MITVEQVLNLKVKITNLLDESISGTIHALSLKQRVLALKIHNPSQVGKQGCVMEDSFKIINTAFIKSVTVLPPFPKKNMRSESPCVVAKIDLKQLEAALSRMIEDSNQDGTGESSTQSGSVNQQGSQGVSADTGKSKPFEQKSSSGLVGRKVFDRLTSILGKENVQWQANESILLFKEVTLSKPYALNKISLSKRTQNSKHIDKARSAVREAWLAHDSSRRGG